MLRSAAHETYHFVEGYSKKDADDLREYVLDTLKENGVDIEKALEKYAKQEYATRDEQISELVADSMFDVFSNEDFIKNLTAKNQTLAKRLANHIGELVNKIREAVKMLSVRYSNPEIKALMDDAEKLDTIRNMLLEGYKNAGENFKAEQAEGQKNNAVVINVKYSLSSNARKELHKALYDKTYNQEVLLRDETPTIMLGHNGVKNHPMVMKVSHIRENVFTEKEAKKLGLKIDSKTHYHGLGEDFFLDVIDSLDNVKEAYRGTKIATDTSRRENYFLLVTEFQDKNGNTINVPVYINADAQVNRVFFKTNKIATVFGRDDFRIYINRQIKEKNLVKIKNRNSNPSEADTPLMPTYKETASKNSIPKTIKSVKQNLSESDADYLEAVENGDTETAQRIVDEAAKIAGYEYKLYHQTGNDFTVFDTRHKGAGTGDSETPFGVFMKPSSNNIGLKGQKQMPVYAAIKNPLVVGDRDNLMHELKKDATVNAVQEEIKRVNVDYKQRVDQAGKDLQSYLIEYRKKHPDEPRSEIYNDDGFNEIYEREDSLIDEWTATIDKLSIDSKNAITDYLKSQGYDGVIIGKDAGSFGRETKTYIALDNTQVKSADPVTYDDNGNVIPLSERFKESNVDIRYSMKQTDPIQAHYAEVMRENRNLKNIISALDDMQYSSARSNIHLDGRDIHNIAGRLLKSASSKYELKAFEDELTAVYDYMANGGEVDTEAVFQTYRG